MVVLATRNVLEAQAESPAESPVPLPKGPFEEIVTMHRTSDPDREPRPLQQDSPQTMFSYVGLITSGGKAKKALRIWDRYFDRALRD